MIAFPTQLLIIAVLFISGICRVNSFQDAENGKSSEKGKVAVLLRLQWEPGECLVLRQYEECIEEKVADKWTIHGLWRVEDCEETYDLNLSAISKATMDELNKYWVSFRSNVNNIQFWKNEFHKHGCVTNGKQKMFFDKALRLYKQNDPVTPLEKAGIVPGRKYKTGDIEKALPGQQILCKNDNTIDEIEICFDKELNSVSCDRGYNACSGESVFYPTKKQIEEDATTNANGNTKHYRISVRNLW